MNIRVVIGVLVGVAIFSGLTWFRATQTVSQPATASRTGTAPATSASSTTPVPAAQHGHTVTGSKNPTAIPAAFEEGKHYHRLSAKITTNKDIQELIAETPGKIQVIEFFNYGCYWCQQLHPVLTEWAKNKPENVVFYRFPVVFNKLWAALAKTYLVIKSLGKDATLDPLFFTEIHQKHINLADEKILKEFLIKHGIEDTKFFELYNSFAINTEMAKINNLGNAYQITLSPSVVINTPSGSYLSTATMVGSEQKLLEVLNFLIAKDSVPPKSDPS